MNKTIIYCGTGSDRDFNGKLERGIQQACKDNKIHLIALSSLYNYDTHVASYEKSRKLERGENSIFELANTDDIDGAIILATHFINISKVTELADRFKAAGIPVVILDDREDGCYCIEYDDTNGMRGMVKHLIDVHNCRKINLIAGFRDSMESNNRIEAFKEVLADNNIEFEEERMGYGDFGANTYEVIDRFYNSSLEFPDAIVCCNDLMAMHVIDYLGEHGMQVPEDVIVTGYDGIIEGELYYPALSTIKRGLFQSGYCAVQTLISHWEGKPVEALTRIEPIHVFGQSCGCKPKDRVNISRFSKFHYKIYDIYKDFNYDLVNLTNDMTAAVTMDDLLGCIFSNTFINDMEKVVFCFNDNLLSNNDIFGKKDNDEELFTEIMTAYYFNENGKIVSERFPLWQMLPESCRDSSTDVFTYIHPLYFNRKILGYVVVLLTDYYDASLVCNSMFRTLSNAIGDFCIRSDKEAAVKQLDYMYVRDPLTMLFNRRGLIRESELIFEKSQTGQYIMGIGVDLDGLKSINDNFGHDEGDNAITQCANAIEFANSGNDVCARIGGDEFFVLGVCEAKEDANFFIDKVDEYLAKYNRSSGKPYKVSCSCGSDIAPAGKVKTLETIIKFADREMYRVKQIKKSELSGNDE